MTDKKRTRRIQNLAIGGGHVQEMAKVHIPTEAEIRRHRRVRRENYFKVRFNRPTVTSTIETARHLEPAEFIEFLQETLDAIKEPQ